MTQEERRAETSERLIATGISLVARRGLASVTTKTIAQEAGITWGAAQYLFGNKIGFLTSLGRRLLEDLKNQAPIPGRAASSVRAGLETFVWSVWCSYSSPSYIAWIELVRGSRGDREMRDALKVMQNDYIDHISALWHATVPHGTAGAPNEIIMHHIVLTLSGLAARRIFLHDEIAENEHIHLCIDMAVRMVMEKTQVSGS
ncbi:hypothetical protein CH339_16510 [Rhodobium orientis]|uniref:HTH tetR-type domain-containing protein n=2 Tax=Rhodobium orientis TaxID=34017 RepID=A0A327JR35_9HYPH|nr:hypothetical protein [Rhodobium orientis]RAI25838.1 hypothetical protein CH339_16510 [Rhodobium orientis]